MVVEPNCFKRQCKFYLGIIQTYDDELEEVNSCEAFREGIPFEIAYGDNKHLTPFEGDNGIQYEREE